MIRAASSQLIDLCGVDYPERAERFDVVYHLLSLRQNHRLRVQVTTDADHPVPSVAGVFSRRRMVSSAKRGTFTDHVLRSSGSAPHPHRLRVQGPSHAQDFPLSGYVEVRYDDERKAIVYESRVKLAQEFRSFDFLSPWEGAEERRARRCCPVTGR